MDSIIDLSQPIEDNMPVYPGDTRTGLYQSSFLSSDGHNNHRLEINMHSGTHIDSPMHMTDSSSYISQEPLESFYGNGCIVDARSLPVITMKEEYEDIIKEGSIVLLHTGWDRYYGTPRYYEYPTVSADFCRHLIRNNIKMLGMDMPSPDNYPFESHKLLFEHGVYILENMTNLDKLLDISHFEVIAFPLKIKADSSITRAVARW